MLENFIGSYPKALNFEHFPTRQQAFVWRNWEMVPTSRLAEVLETSVKNVVALAEQMSLRVPAQVNELWLVRGYITIIRRNWHILPYDQLLTLLGWPEEELAYVLKEDDFLYHKLGDLKPACESLRYKPLNQRQIKETENLKQTIEKHFPVSGRIEKELPFDFLNEFKNPPEANPISRRNKLTDDILIDENWSIILPEETKRTRVFAERFIAAHVARWGEQLNISSFGITDYCIDLSVQPDSSLLSESHSVSIGHNVININSVDEVGLLRGLQWLEKEMQTNGGPYLQKGNTDRSTQFDLRFIYSYFALYGDPLLNPELDPYPDGLLARLADLGVNGIWLQGILYQLSHWEVEPSLSAGYEKRLENLRKLTERAANFGIGVYLYLNEPRCMPLSFFEKHPELKGNERLGDSVATLCTSHPAVIDFLRNGCIHIFENIPELAGVFTITMSENPTNCYSHHFARNKTKCPRCLARSASEVVAEVNTVIAESIHSVKPEAKVIAWNWAWPEDVAGDILGLMPESIEFMSTSEFLMPTNVGGVADEVHDYTLSQLSPGPRALKEWELARKNGMKSVAKIQLNNTWEFSATPYIPVLDQVNNYLSNLSEARVDALMLSWTLGGCPSLNLDLASRAYWGNDSDPEKRLEALAVDNFGEDSARVVREAWRIFSKSFREFPFSVGVVYHAPTNFGPMNLLYLKPSGYEATMVGFPYDDLEKWRYIYPADVLKSQFKKMTEGWEKGLKILKNAREFVSEKYARNYSEMEHYAIAAYCHFRSTYLQIRFVKLRDELLANQKEKQNNVNLKESLKSVLIEEISLAKKLHKLVLFDSKIGFEASNHYFYTAYDLREKVLNCEHILNSLKEG